MRSILNLVYIPTNSPKFHDWHDGYTEAIRMLSDKYDIETVNLASEKPKSGSYDAVIVKSNWGWVVDKYAREALSEIPKKIIMVSGSLPPVDPNFYNCILYETPWYRNQIPSYYRGIVEHAFGIDTDLIKGRHGLNKIYDWICVGDMTKPYKRQKLLPDIGNGLVIGIEPYIYSTYDSRKYISPKEMPFWYGCSKKCVIPFELHGGGERVLMEARSCGLPVEVQPDNPKLLELLECPIWNQYYYAEQIQKVLKWIL